MIANLPESWRPVRLGDCLQRRREAVLPSTLSGQKINLVELDDIQDGGRGGVNVRSAEPGSLASLKTAFKAGDILYGKLRPYLNKVAIAPVDGYCSTEIWALAPARFIDIHFTRAFLSSQQFVERVTSRTKGANLPRLDSSSFDSVDLPLPPLSEQQRIAEILEGAGNIRALRANAEIKTSGIVSAIFRGLFGDPVANPKGWPISNLGGLLLGPPKNGLYKPSDFYGSGTPIIRIGNFYAGRLNRPEEFQRVEVTESEAAQFATVEGEILINRVNSMEYLGKSALVKGLTEATVYESNIMRLRVNLEKALPAFLIDLFQHPAFLAKLRGKAKKAVNQASINQSDVLSLRCPVPPLQLQKEFAALVEEVEFIHALNQRSSVAEGHLTNSLLARAFAGDLTEEWRERNAAKLEQEARDRDVALAASGVKLALAPKTPDVEAIFKRRTDGAYAELTREQHAVLEAARRAVGGVKSPRWFTAEHVAKQLGGTWRKHIYAIEAALCVLAARGLIISVSREDAQPITGEIYYGTAYRLPLSTYELTLGDEAGNKIVDNEGTGILLGETDGDIARQRELKRLGEQLRKGRTE